LHYAIVIAFIEFPMRASSSLAFSLNYLVAMITTTGMLAIGDALYTGSSRIRFRGIPSFSPEVFAYVSNATPSKYKNYRKGLKELLEEGAVNMLRDRDDDGNGSPILAAVGQLQFDVVQYRLEVRNWFFSFTNGKELVNLVFSFSLRCYNYSTSEFCNYQVGHFEILFLYSQ